MTFSTDVFRLTIQACRFLALLALAGCMVAGWTAAALAQSPASHGQHRSAANPATVKIGSLSLETPWTRATPAGAKVGGGYMKITNTGKDSDRLIGGTLAQAGRFELHEMSVTDGVMRMRELAKGLEIKPGETVELKPGGYHVMFMDLKEPLKQGATLRGTLVFEKAGTVAVDYHVAPVGAADHMHH